ncbi:hypothetical protein DL769_006253 [Monosporascus sp. CRB-8-3]|nr:hypothetical protein DL769_006253 [Monosporascus sp. CRB-8-3]
MDPIAIVGFSFRLPQEALDERSFWDILQSRRSLMTPWPESRLDLDTYYDGNEHRKPYMFSARGGHFLKGDVAAFDAPFFSITENEAIAMDPQHRLALETSYRALENAGISVESIRGSRTAVFANSFLDDYSTILTKDLDTIPRMAATGIASSIIPNRISWYFNLLGPSVHVDTACSGSLVALDLACQSIRNGDASAALVLTTNLLLAPETSIRLSNMNFLSPDSLSFSFDSRANGYARGEGVICLVIKPLSKAVQEGDMVRAIIRSTGTNQDGRTPSLSQPHPQSQELLIKEVYKKAGLCFDATRYVEAHGTGTAVGDPVEMKAIGEVFKGHRSAELPLYVGSVKSNIGHLEGSSGLAGIIKTVLTLERGIIPPNALFEKINPNIDADFLHIEVPTKCVPWPVEGLRRASVSSFGIGGTNAHAILDDACHYLHSIGVHGNHLCTRGGLFNGLFGGEIELSPSPAVTFGARHTTSGRDGNGALQASEGIPNLQRANEPEPAGEGTDTLPYSGSPKLLVWTAADEKAVQRTVDGYELYLDQEIAGSPTRLNQLAYTLAARRQHMEWRTFAILDNANGDELVSKDIGRPESSQPLCTALQIALVELLKSFGIEQMVVCGHSSGEIAAAYTTGALSQEAACKVAYYRGQLASRLKATATSPGAMISVGLSKDGVLDYLARLPPPSSAIANEDTVHVACINSPRNLDCPAYPFDNSRRYWAESRFSRDSRLPGSAPASVLGKRSHDWNPLEPRWRHVLSPDTVPWLRDHVVSNKVLLPGAGMLIAAIQAATQYVSPSRKIAGFYFKEAHFLHPIVIDDGKGATEMVTHLRPRPPQSPGSEPAWLEVKIFTYANDRWAECFESALQVRDEEVAEQIDADNEERLENERVTRQYQNAVEACTTLIDARSFYNFIRDFSSIRYGQSFRLLRDIKWNGRECSVASIKAARPDPRDKRDLVHPAALDAAVHLAVVSLSKGLARLDATLVPNKLFNTWISTKWLNSSSVKVLSETRLRPGGSHAISTVHVIGDEGSLLCTMERLILAAVSHHKTPRKDSMLLHGIDWKPQLSLLSPRQLHQWCHANTEARDEASVASYYHNLGSALLSSVRRVLMELSVEDLRTAPAHMQMYIASMEYHISQRPGDSEQDEAHVETLLQRCEEERPAWKLNRHVIRNLRELITGRMDVLELFFHESMAEEYYKWVFNQICDVRFRRLLALLSHENPGIRILEVGAGTGGMTSHVLPVLQEFERQDGSACFSEYAYTDISPAFLDEAKRKFQDRQGRISFHTLDLERDSRDQGFAAGSFDVVVAGSVIHATSDLAATLQNIHRLLTPGGHLLYFELTADDDPCLNVPWGLLPGWWMSKEEWRTNSPLIREHRWDQTLRQAGFSGNDVILRDHEDDACHLWSMMISTKVSTSEEASKYQPRPDSGIVLVIDPNSGDQVALSQLIAGTRKAIAVSLNSLRDIEWKEGETVISLLEIGKPLLAKISEACFSDVKSLIQRSCKLLWVTSTSVQDAEYPSYSVAIGFLRTIRSEAPEKRIVTLAIESADGASSLASLPDYIFRILDATMNGTSPEIEFVVQDGYLTTGRLKQRKALHKQMVSLISRAVRQEPWLPGPALVAHVGTPDHERFHFVEDLRYHRNGLTPYFVEIEAKSWALNFHDSLTARRRLQQDELGFESSDLEKAISYIQSGREIDRVVVSVDHAHTVPKSLSNYSTWKLDPKASYVVAGGLGGIGRSVVRWMARKGARHLILLSRSGSPSSVAASETISEVETQGVDVAKPRCDVSSAAMLSKVLHECQKTMPPIKGCVNSIMVLQDSIFDNMSHCQWKTTLKSKVDASWNLHRQLPGDMDFFILLSSLSGIYGNSGQSNYAAGSTYQDALARHRISQGQKAISFDLGLMRTIGRIAETGQVRRVQEVFEDMQVIEEDEFIALVDLHCDPSRQPLPDAQVLVGARTAADFISSGQEPVQRLTRPLFSGFLRPLTGWADKTAQMTDQVNDTATLFRRAMAVSDKAQVVVEALRAKLARALGVTPEHIDPSRSMIDYGVDSLVAVELRSWSRNNFGSNLPVFDIMGGKSIATIGGIIVETSSHRKEP